MIAARDGDEDGSRAAFVAAQEWEASPGYTRATLHTSHQMALTGNFGGHLTRLRRYYDETLATFQRLRNREGMAAASAASGSSRS